MSEETPRPESAPEVERRGTSVWPSTGDALQKHSGWFAVLGICLIILGVLAIALPTVASLGVTLVLGWLLLIGGVLQFIHAFTAREWGGFFFEVLTALLYGFVGVVLLSNPLVGMFTLTIVLVAFLAIEGIFKTIMAFQIRPSANWGWLLFSGIVSLILAGLIWSRLPGDALWVLGLLIGINMIFSGWSLTMLALASRDLASALGGGEGKGSKYTPT